jgi:hypothetical protein
MDNRNEVREFLVSRQAKVTPQQREFSSPVSDPRRLQR